jgi:hypothetical protein
VQARVKYPALDLIRMSLELENKIDSHGDLVPLPGLDTTFLAVNHYAQGIAVRYHAQLPDRLRRRLQDLPELVLLEDPARVLAILAEYVPATRFFAASAVTSSDRLRPANTRRSGFYVEHFAF